MKNRDLLRTGQEQLVMNLLNFMCINMKDTIYSVNLQNVSKSFGAVTAVSDASVEIPENCLFGLIGPDGAGKTTLFRIITSLLKYDKGIASVFGYDTIKDYKKIRHFTGYMPGRFSLYPDLTVEENLHFYATIFRTTIKQNYHLVRPVYELLEPFKNRLSRDLSGGMKQKLALSCALIHNPRLLVLDEPTTGVDVVSRKEFWENLKVLKDSGMTILVSTPYMDEAAQCDKIALMQSGVIMEYDEPVKILERFGKSLFEIHTSGRFDLLHILRTRDDVKSSYLFGEFIHVTMQSHETDRKTFIKQIKSMGYNDVQVRSIKPDMEDCFIEAVENQKRK